MYVREQRIEIHSCTEDVLKMSAFWNSKVSVTLRKGLNQITNIVLPQKLYAFARILLSRSPQRSSIAGSFDQITVQSYILTPPSQSLNYLYELSSSFFACTCKKWKFVVQNSGFGPCQIFKLQAAVIFIESFIECKDDANLKQP